MGHTSDEKQVKRTFLGHSELAVSKFYQFIHFKLRLIQFYSSIYLYNYGILAGTTGTKMTFLASVLVFCQFRLMFHAYFSQNA